MVAPRKYPVELQERAVRLWRSEQPRRPIAHLARELGVHPEALRNWIRQDEANRGERDDRLTGEQLEEPRRRRPSPRDIEETWLGEQIERIHKESDGTYGSPKVHAQLRREGIRTSRKRVER